MQAEDRRRKNRQPRRKRCGFAVDGLALPMVRRHILRQSDRVRWLEQLLRQGVQIAAQMARAEPVSFDEKCCSA
jgi:hypothetical protein